MTDALVTAAGVPSRKTPTPTPTWSPDPFGGSVLPGLSSGQWVLVTVALLLAAAAGLWWWRRRDHRGWATGGQLSRDLSVSALRRAAPEIRPSLTAGRRRATAAPPYQVGYSLGRSVRPHGRVLWVRLDRACRVIGPMGSGKTFRFFAPLVRNAPGPVLATSTKPDLYELTVAARRKVGPVVALDPEGIVPGATPLRWNPVSGCEDSRVAELRAAGFVAAVNTGRGDSEGAAFYRRQAMMVLRALLHAAALAGRDLHTVLRWSRRLDDPEPQTILSTHPDAAPGWADELRVSRTGDDRTIGNTTVTVSNALACFSHADVLAAATPAPGTETDIEDLLSRNGTIYLLGKDKSESSLAPLVTAIAEDILDRAEKLAHSRPARRLDPPLVAALDEAANIAPIPSLRQRVADGRGRGLCIAFGVQAWAQAEGRFGKTTAAELAASTNVLLVFGGSKDPSFNRDTETLSGQRKVARKSRTSGWRHGRSTQVGHEWEPVLRAHEVQQLPAGVALAMVDNLPPFTTRMPALYETREWRAITDEVAAVRAAADAARVPTPPAPAGGPDGSTIPTRPLVRTR